MRKGFAAALAVALSFPGSLFGGVGRTAGQTLVQPMAARPSGLAEAYCADTAGADSIGYNPAGLALLPGSELLALYNGGFAGDSFISAVYAHPIGDFGLAGGVYSYNSGNVEILDDSGRSVLTEGQRDIVYIVGLGMRFRQSGLSAGVAGKLLRTQLVEQYTGQAFVGDAGLRWDIPDTAVSMAVAAQNIGPDFKIADGTEKVPMVVRAGAAYRFTVEPEGSRVAGLAGVLEPAMNPKPVPHQLTILGDAVFRLGDRITVLALGAEYAWRSAVAVRIGGKIPLGGTGFRNAAASAGLGVKIRWIRLDYSAEVTSPAALHRVSVSFVF